MAKKKMRKVVVYRKETRYPAGLLPANFLTMVDIFNTLVSSGIAKRVDIENVVFPEESPMEKWSQSPEAKELDDLHYLPDFSDWNVVRPIDEVHLKDIPAPSTDCPWCKHSLVDNEHGFDQNDGHMEGGQLVYHGACSYCSVCFPIDQEKLATFKREFNKRLNNPPQFDAQSFKTTTHDLRIPEPHVPMGKLETVDEFSQPENHIKSIKNEEGTSYYDSRFWEENPSFHSGNHDPHEGILRRRASSYNADKLFGHSTSTSESSFLDRTLSRVGHFLQRIVS